MDDATSALSQEDRCADGVAVKPAPLPLSCPPRGLSRVEAGQYLGISPSLFDQLVKDGQMPLPKVIHSRRVWDRLEVDAAFADLPNTEEAAEENPWHRKRGAAA